MQDVDNNQGEQIGLNFSDKHHIRKSKSLDSKIKSEKSNLGKVSKPEIVKSNSSEYSEDYIKDVWAKDYYIFDVRDYESIGKSEWKDWTKEITNETVAEMVKKRNFSNSGHSSYLIDKMINEHGWKEEQIVNYVLRFRETHLNTLKNGWKSSIVNAPIGMRDDLNYLKEVYSYYLCCCKNLNQTPESFENLISKMRSVK